MSTLTPNSINIVFEKYFPRPIPFLDNPKKIVISTNYQEANCRPGIYVMDLEKSTIKLIMEYPNCESMKPSQHGHFLENKSSLIVFGGLNKIYQKINLKTKEIHETTNNQTQSFSKCGREPKTLSVSQNTVDILAVQTGEYYRLDVDENTVTKLNGPPIRYKGYCYDQYSLLYLSQKQQLMVLCGLTEKIWVKHYSSDHDEWRVNQLQMPGAYDYQWHATYDALIAFGEVVIIFCLDNECGYLIKIWISDQNKTWHKLMFPAGCEIGGYDNFFVFKDENDMVYLVNFSKGKIWKSHLLDIVPRKFHAIYEKANQPLIDQYIREHESAVGYQIPICIQKLILKYTPYVQSI